jgi:alginate O-acetyltransferase complex protein AlgI
VLEKFIFRPKKDAPLPILLLRRIGVLAVVYFGWLLFYFEDLSVLGTALSSLFCLGGNAFWDLYARTKLLNNLFFLAVAMLACTPIIPFLHKKLSARAEHSAKWQTAEGVISVAAPILLLLLSLIFLVGNTYNPFLYYQF